MSDAHDNSDPAFPAPEAGVHHFSDPAAYTGMSLRDYFAAHAPSEPQTWFQPVMPMERPQFPFALKDITKEERRELDGYEEWLGLGDLKELRVIAYVQARDEYKRKNAVWERLLLKERFTQWPYAWADAMLAARANPKAADPVRDAAHELLEALKEARACIMTDRTSLADAHMDPVTNRVDEDGEAALEEYDAVLAQIDGAIAAATGGAA
ncbi:hypothetical protein [Ideonella livida]|uniref:Uncharacterized protein n=1 Tax=Ideonella livida TaxID=2707176 RepID=A0A7C9TGG4_9BURK|nr:hypothetical protein [Ideonella livida]NDY89719.1 hypothetical protein [Ideonella livida]